MKKELLKLVLLAVVGGIFTSPAAAMGYDYEAGRMSSGERFLEEQTSKRIGEVSPVEIKGELAPVAKAKITAKAHDFSKLTYKAPPALKAEVSSNKRVSSDRPLLDPVVVAGGLVVVGTVALIATVSATAAVIVGGGVVCAVAMGALMAD